MKRSFSIVFALATFVFSSAIRAEQNAQSSTDPAGTWHWVQDYGQGPVKNWLVLHTADKLITGTYLRDEEEFSIKEGKVEDGKFSFQLVLEYKNKPVEITTTGKASGDKLSAKSSIVFKGETTELEFTADRVTRPEDFVGAWALHIETDGQTFMPIVEIACTDGKLSGKYVTEEAGTHAIEKIDLKDNQLVFALAFEVDGTGVNLKYKGVPRGHAISGTVNYEIGSAAGTAEFLGTRRDATKKVNE